MGYLTTVLPTSNIDSPIMSDPALKEKQSVVAEDHSDNGSTHDGHGGLQRRMKSRHIQLIAIGVFPSHPTGQLLTTLAS